MTAVLREFWDGVHQRRDRSGPGEPHPYLVEHTGSTDPGGALDLGCGSGANAIWLASQGWTVTGVDLSGVALERAAEHAEQAGVSARMRWLNADLEGWTTSETFDLVTAFFVHSPLELDSAAVLARAADRVSPGGALLVIGHYTLPPWAWDPAAADDLPRAAELATVLELREPSWRVRRAEEIDRKVTSGNGSSSSVADAVLHAERLA
jgi:SAM-dependent methyltransferase